MYARYQPLPISTGAVGVDRCGNVHVYAAPRTVTHKVCWPPCGWPIPPSFVGWRNSGVGSGGAWGGGWGWSGMGPHVMPVDLGGIMTGGAAMANWLIANRAAAKPAA